MVCSLALALVDRWLTSVTLQNLLGSSESLPSSPRPSEPETCAENAGPRNVRTKMATESHDLEVPPKRLTHKKVLACVLLLAASFLHQRVHIYVCVYIYILHKGDDSRSELLNLLKTSSPRTHTIKTSLFVVSAPRFCVRGRHREHVPPSMEVHSNETFFGDSSRNAKSQSSRDVNFRMHNILT